ncbi:MAG TPA: UDP-N-acetylmuramoyl-tripeptide--D-alanyl-D-alanine ligase [Candidatus Sabulitectum sp.]|nr:UDP-N-acetylmuramoyl-tripeptide--D-alanyl-D-alanine ligase [Candidatus Sabulitectum sp.]
MRSLKALGARLGCQLENEYLFDTAVIDSREARPGTLFFALSGQNTDGHNFVADVLGEGGAAVVSRDGFTGAVLEVDSVEEALLEAGSWARDSMEFPVLGLTGSSGKTTTRRMIAAALSLEYRTAETRGNLNNHLGLPLTLLNTPEDTEFLVLEMGMNHPGEILRLGWAARPHHALITCIGRAHMEFFDSLDGVARAKSELLETTMEGGIAVIPADNPILAETASSRNLDVVTHGAGGDCWVEEGRAMPWGIPLDLRYRGGHNMENALCAIAFSERMGVDPADAAAALARLEPSTGRGEVFTVQGRTVVDESYNANPDSTAACLRASSSFPGQRVAVLGDMLELGENSPECHLETLSLAFDLGFDPVITVGSRYRAASGEAGFPAVCTDSWNEALEQVRRMAGTGCTILVKGSNSMGLMGLVNSLRREGF